MCCKAVSSCCNTIHFVPKKKKKKSTTITNHLPAFTPWDRTDAEHTVTAVPRKQNFFTYILKMGRFTVS